ncbi:MAG TPA: MoaD/ThiS family protein [Sphingobium sp.]|nr:MoaD/ThiS family protein [Sphingobium sp.]
MASLDILYFAWVREVIGRDDEQIARPAPDMTVAMLIADLAERGGGYAEALGDPTRLRAALDQRFVPLDTSIGDARELAIFPPVTGG